MTSRNIFPTAIGSIVENESQRKGLEVSMTNTEIAETYFEAYRSRDLTKALLAPDVTMQHAVTPQKLVGKDTVIDFMLALMSGLDDLTIERHVAEGEFVATMWKAHTVWGRMPVCSVFRISDGLIKEVRGFFDPRPILGES
jgi:ketosteroid isomerase-like protein